MKKIKTFFITGGAGFLGYFITKKLLAASNNRVVIYDNYKCYVDVSKKNHEKYLKFRKKSLAKYRGKISWIRGDIVNKDELKDALKKSRPDIIIHLAAVPVANICNQNPQLARKVMLDGTFNLLNCVHELNLATRIVYASSSMVYGHFLKDQSGNILAARENQICEPVNIYGALKLAGEYIIKAYSEIYGISYSIIRPSAIYGPTDCNRRVTEIFLNNALTGKEIVLDNSGLNQLDFTYVEDTARGFILVANSTKAIGKTFNITRGEGRSLKELAAIINNFIPEIKVITKEIQTNLPERGGMDISQAKGILKYRPRYSLEKGIEKYFKFIGGKEKL